MAADPNAARPGRRRNENRGRSSQMLSRVPQSRKFLRTSLFPSRSSGRPTRARSGSCAGSARPPSPRNWAGHVILADRPVLISAPTGSGKTRPPSSFVSMASSAKPSKAASAARRSRLCLTAQGPLQRRPEESRNAPPRNSTARPRARLYMSARAPQPSDR